VSICLVCWNRLMSCPLVIKPTRLLIIYSVYLMPSSIS
jgi:hypothetical protein